MHVWNLVGISGFTRVLLVYLCQQGAHPRDRPTPLAPTMCVSVTNFFLDIAFTKWNVGMLKLPGVYLTLYSKMIQ